jgi:hypothetical protein
MTELIVRLLCSMYSNATLFTTIKDYQLRLTKFGEGKGLATVQPTVQYVLYNVQY